MSNAQMVYDDLPPLPPAPEMEAPRAQQQSFAPRQLPTDNGIPVFKIEAKRQKDGSFRNVEYVEIKTPGDTKAMPCHKVDDRLRRKYAHHYRLWREGLEAAPDGTPLEMWPVLTPAQVHELKANNIFTVEQLAGVSDGAGTKVPMLRTLKNRAHEWLKVKKDADRVDEQTRENEALRANQTMLEEQLEALSKKMEAMAFKESANMEDELDKAVEGKRKPGRPRKTDNE